MRASRHPRERERLRALHALKVLDTEPEEAFDAIAALAAEFLQMPVALVSFVDEHRQWFKARFGFPATETSLEASFCAHAILDEDVTVVEDATRDPRFADNPLVVTAAPQRSVRFYAGAPLLSVDGLPLGTLCVLDHRVRRFGRRNRRRLALLRDQTAVLLEHRRLRIESAEHRRRTSTFLVEIGRELRAPLAVVLGGAERLVDSLERPEHLATTYALMRGGERLRAIVDELFDLSRIEAGRLGLRREPCALESLLDDVDARVRGDARERGLGWRIECSDPLPVAVLTDGRRLCQVLTTLVGDALGLAERGSVVLRVTADTSPDGSTTLEFTVRHDAVDASAAPDERALVPPRRQKTDTVPHGGDAGLGLTLAGELVRLLGGTLDTMRRGGVGDRFRLTLPCEPLGTERRLPRAAGAAGRLGPVPESGTTRAPSRRHVLIVNDGADVANAIARALRRRGYTVDLASGEAAALALAASTPPDCVLLDHRSPGLRSSTLLARLRAREALAGTRFVSLSGTPASDTERERSGFDLHLPKPIAASAVIAALGSLLDPAVDGERDDMDR